MRVAASRHSLTLIVLLAGFSFGVARCQNAYTIYTIPMLPPPPGYTLDDATSVAYGINDSGHVVGRCTFSRIVDRTTVQIETHGFEWDGVTLRDLGPNTQAFRINGLNAIVGVAHNHAALWVNGQVKDLGTLGGATSMAYDINDAGTVVGTAQKSNQTNTSTPVFWTADGVITSLGGLDGVASAINNKGTVAGKAVFNASLQGTLFLPMTSGQAFITSDYDFDWIGEISDDGRIAGTHRQKLGSSTYDTPYAFLWKKNVMIRLDQTPIGLPTDSGANGINNLGTIVGHKNVRAVRWTGVEEHYLNDFIQNHLGWKLEAANDVNNKGVIVGAGILFGARRAFIMIPYNGWPISRNDAYKAAP